MKKNKKLLIKALSLSTAAITAPVIIFSATSETSANTNEALEAKKNELKQFLEKHKFEFGVGGFRNRDIVDITNKFINPANNDESLKKAKEIIDEYYGYLTKYYLAYQAFAFGDPFYYKNANLAPGVGGTTYQAGQWGGIRQWSKIFDESYKLNKNSFTDMVTHFIRFFYLDSPDPIWFGAHEDQFQRKFSQYKSDANNTLNGRGAWNAFRGLINPIKNINTRLDTPDTTVDNDYYSHVGPLAIFFTMYATMQGNIGGAGNDATAGWGNQQRIINGVRKYKELFKDLLSQVNSLEEYKNSDFYKNLIGNQKNQFNIVPGYINEMINKTKNMVTINQDPHTIQRGATGKVNNLLNNMFGVGFARIDDVQAKLNEAKKQAAANYTEAQKQALDSLAKLEDGKIDSAYIESEKAKINGNSYPNVEELNTVKANYEKLNTLWTDINSTYDSYSTKSEENKYLTASPEKQTAYNEALENFKTNLFALVEDKKQLISQDPKALETQFAQLKKTLQTKYEELNGPDNKNKAIEVITSHSSALSPEAINKLKESVNTADEYSDLEKIINNQETFNSNANALLQTLQAIKNDPAAQDLNDLIPNEETRKTVEDALKNAAEVVTANSEKVNSFDFDKVKELANKLNEAKTIIDNNKRTPEEEELYQQLLAKKEHIDALLQTPEFAPYLGDKAAELQALIDTFKDDTKKANADKLRELITKYDNALTGANNTVYDNFNKELDQLPLSDSLKSTFKDQIKHRDIEKISEALNNTMENAKRVSNVYKNALGLKKALEEKKSEPMYKLSPDGAKQNYDNFITNDLDRFINNITADTQPSELKELQKQSFKVSEPLRQGKTEYETLLGNINSLKVSDTIKNNLINELNKLNSQNEALTFATKLDPYFDLEVNLERLQNLNETQKEAIWEKYKSQDSLEGLQQVANEATTLDEAVKNFKDALKNANELDKNQKPYKFASDSKKQAFDTALSDAQAKDNNLSDLSAEQINALKDTLVNAQNDLNGETNFNEAVAKALSAIKEANKVNNNPESSFLSDTYLENIKNELNGADSLEKINGIKDKYLGLIKKVSTIKNTIDKNEPFADDNSAIKTASLEKGNSQETLDAITELNNEYNPSQLGEPLPFDELDPESVNQMYDKVVALEKKASDEQNNFNSKKEYIDQINALGNLSEVQKSKFIKDILDEDINNVPALQGIVANAQELENAMETLGRAIYDARGIKDQNQYLYASKEPKDAFDALTSDEAFNQLARDTFSSFDKALILEKAKALNEARKALDGDLQFAKSKATQIDGLENLSTAQKQTIKDNISKANTVEEVESMLKNANDLNINMGTWANTVAQANAVKQTNKYTQASAETKEAFDALTTADKLNKENITTIDPAQVLNTNNALKEAMDALDGDSNFEQAQNDLIDAIKKAPFLSEEAKNQNIKLVKATAKPEDLKKLQNNLNDLSEKITALNNTIQKANEVKNTPSYSEASTDKKKLLDDNNGWSTELLNRIPKDNDLLLNKTALYSNNLEQYNTDLSNAIKGLDGTSNLNRAKEDANSAIDGLEHLSDEYKATLKALVDSKNTVADVNNVVTKATELNNSTKEMKDSLSKLEAITNQPKYKGVSQETKAKVTEALNQAKGLLTNNLLNNNVTKEAVDEANKALKEALEAVNTELLGVDELKDNLVKEIDKLAHLSQAQKDALKAKVAAVHTKDEINGIKKTANELDTAMDNLAKTVAKATDVKTTPNYEHASNEPKQAFDQVASEDNLNSLAKDNQTSIDPNEINAKSQTLNDAINNLDGDKNISNAKKTAREAISTKENLEPNQKDGFISELDNLNTPEDVNKVVEKATALDNAIAELKNTLKTINENKETEPAKYNYLNASDEKIKALEEAISKATEGLNDAKSVTNSAAVDEMVNKLSSLNNDLKQADANIDGNANLAKAKEDALAKLGQMENLSPEHKTDDTNAINNLNSVSEVNAKIAEIDKLNKATKALADKLTEAQNVKNSANFNKASDESQSALNTAIQNAMNVLEDSKLKAGNNSEEAINTLTEKLATALENIQNDSTEISKAQEEAKKAIDELTNLSNEQKQQLKNKIDASNSKNKINEIVNNGKAIDSNLQAMKDLLTQVNDAKNTKNYLLADPDKQEKVNNLASTLENAINANQNVDEFSLENNSKLVNDLTQALNDLNGLANLNNSKAKLGQYDNLDANIISDKQEALDKANSLNELNQIVQDTKLLDDRTAEMLKAYRKLAPFNETELNKTLSDEAKEKVSQALNKAKKVLSSSQKLNKSDADLVKITKELNDALTFAKENGKKNNPWLYWVLFLTMSVVLFIGGTIALVKSKK
ncbi:hypothetical protein [Mycoplasma sp. Z1473D]